MPVIEVPVSSVDPPVVVIPWNPRRPWPGRIAVACVMLPLILILAPLTGRAAPLAPHDPVSAVHAAAAPGDSDDDGIPDEMDPDDDDDAVSDSTDPDPVNAGPPPAESPGIIAPGQDTDQDGIENVMDPDDDNDAVEDDEDPAPFTPVPPAEEPDEPVEEHPAPSQPDTPVEEHPAPSQPDTPVDEHPVIPQSESNQPASAPLGGPPMSEPVQVESLDQSQDSAPLVVALPSTGNAAVDGSRHLPVAVLTSLALAFGATGMVLHRRANRAQVPARLPATGAGIAR